MIEQAGSSSDTAAERRRHPLRRMPVHFGATPGPRQTITGGSHDLADSPHATSIWVQHTVDRGQIASLLPPGFVPGPVADLMIEVRNLTNITWLAGRGYSIVTLSTSVAWIGGAQPVAGRFQLVLWENMADPIISGREELGFSKLYAEIPDLDVLPARAAGRALWDGFQFLDVAVDELRDVAPNAYAPPSGPGFHWKYMPRTQEWGEHDVSCIVVTPPTAGTRRLLETRLGQGRANFRRASWEQLPTLVHVVNPLADLELGTCLAAGFSRSVGGKDFSDQQFVAHIPD